MEECFRLIVGEDNSVNLHRRLVNILGLHEEDELRIFTDAGKISKVEVYHTPPEKRIGREQRKKLQAEHEKRIASIEKGDSTHLKELIDKYGCRFEVE